MKRLPFLILLFVSTAFFADSQSFNRYHSSRDTVIQSEFLGYEKTLQFTLPLDYDISSNRQFPVIVIFDTQDAPNYDYTLHTIDYLTVNEQMPSSIIVGVACDPGKRISETEFSANDPAGKIHMTEKFLMNELLPMVRKHFHGSLFTTVIGHSNYGTFGTYLLTHRHPEIHAVIAFSPWLQQQNVNLADSLATFLIAGPGEHRTYFRYDYGSDYPQNSPSLRSAFSYTSKTNVDARGASFRGADHRSTPGLYVNQALYEIFELWSAKQSTYFNDSLVELSSAVLKIQKEVETYYGHPIELSLGALNGKGWTLYNSGEIEKSIEAWQLVLKYYPHFSEAYLSIAYAQKDLHQPIDATLQQFEKTLHSNKFYSAKEQEELMREYMLLQTSKHQ